MNDFKMVLVEGKFYPARLIGGTIYFIYTIDGVFGTAYSITLKLRRVECNYRNLVEFKEADSKKIVIPIKSVDGYAKLNSNDFL